MARLHELIHARVPRGIKDAVERLSKETGKAESDLIRDAVFYLLMRQDEIEMDATLEKVVNRMDSYIKADNELLFIEMENKRVSAELRARTFGKYMDSFMADIYLSEKRDEEKSADEIRETLRSSLKVMKARAEHHNMTDEYENRREAPIEYVQNELDRRKTSTEKS